jgi:hypothetical protein
MDNDPYAPPSTRLADSPPENRGSRPRQVTLAVQLLWASLLLGLPSFYLAIDREPEGSLSAMVVVIQLALFALVAYLNVCIGQGRNWARFASLILTVLGLVMLFFLPSPPEVTVIEQLINGLSSMLDVAAMVLLFTRPGAGWFSASHGVDKP